MVRICPLLFAIAVCVTSLPGCAIWRLPVHESSDQLHDSALLIPFPFTRQLEVGQYCKVDTLTDPTSATASAHQVTSIAGRVVSLEGGEVVLEDCIRLERPKDLKPPRLSKVPYVNRLFKNTGVGLNPVPIDGPVRFPNHGIEFVTIIPAEEWPTFREQPYFERIGIDFDFNITE